MNNLPTECKLHDGGSNQGPIILYIQLRQYVQSVIVHIYERAAIGFNSELHTKAR